MKHLIVNSASDYKMIFWKYKTYVSIWLENYDAGHTINDIMEENEAEIRLSYEECKQLFPVQAKQLLEE